MVSKLAHSQSFFPVLAEIDRPMFYYPMVGLINLFVYVLKFPSLQSARSDVALLDVAAGFFGHMDFVTEGELSFPFARDVAGLARTCVERARQTDPPPISGSDHDLLLQTEMEISQAVSEEPWCRKYLDSSV